MKQFYCWMAAPVVMLCVWVTVASPYQQGTPRNQMAMQCEDVFNDCTACRPDIGQKFDTFWNVSGVFREPQNLPTRDQIDTGDFRVVCEGLTEPTPECPWDTVKTHKSVEVGACDAAERCDGSSPFCPLDPLPTPTKGTACRPESGLCDVPAYTIEKKESILCRDPTKPCDVTEYCDGIDVHDRLKQLLQRGVKTEVWNKLDRKTGEVIWEIPDDHNDDNERPWLHAIIVFIHAWLVQLGKFLMEFIYFTIAIAIKLVIVIIEIFLTVIATDWGWVAIGASVLFGTMRWWDRRTVRVAHTRCMQELRRRTRGQTPPYSFLRAICEFDPNEWRKAQRKEAGPTQGRYGHVCEEPSMATSAQGRYRHCTPSAPEMSDDDIKAHKHVDLRARQGLLQHLTDVDEPEDLPQDDTDDAWTTDEDVFEWPPANADDEFRPENEQPALPVG